MCDILISLAVRTMKTQKEVKTRHSIASGYNSQVQTRIRLRIFYHLSLYQKKNARHFELTGIRSLYLNAND